MNNNSRIVVFGGHGLIGSSVMRTLSKNGYSNLLNPFRNEVDCINQAQTLEYLASEKPDCIILAAARTGGINDIKVHPAEFIYQNLRIQCNVIHSAMKCAVKKMVHIASARVYPKD